MNFTKLIEALEIFKKYSPQGEDPETDIFPFDVDYMMMTVDFDNLVMDPADIARLEELDWEVQKSPVWGSRAYTVTDEEIGRYQISYSFRDVFRKKKKALEEAAQNTENS